MLNVKISNLSYLDLKFKHQLHIFIQPFKKIVRFYSINFNINFQVILYNFL